MSTFYHSYKPYQGLKVLCHYIYPHYRWNTREGMSHVLVLFYHQYTKT